VAAAGAGAAAAAAGAGAGLSAALRLRLFIANCSRYRSAAARPLGRRVLVGWSSD
jgi:hypothetical protein